jgi:hypothetical protein
MLLHAHWLQQAVALLYLVAACAIASGLLDGDPVASGDKRGMNAGAGRSDYPIAGIGTDGSAGTRFTLDLDDRKLLEKSFADRQAVSQLI